MATFKICVFKHQKRADGKYPVSIRIYWQGKKAYIRTEYYVGQAQINQKKGAFELNDIFIINRLASRIELFEKEKLKIDINRYSAKKLADYFKKLTSNSNDDDIDILKFGYQYCEQRKVEGKSYSRIVTTLNNLSDFSKGELSIFSLTSKKLKEFEQFLKTERKITRYNQFKKQVTIIRPPCSNHCIADYMSDLRTVFNAAIYEYNDEDLGDLKIKHYPFRKYKMPQIPETPKRNIIPEQIRKLAEFTSTSNRANIARDVFMLSFFFVGMNTADIYNLKKENY